MTKPNNEDGMTTKYVRPSKKVDYICGNCRNKLSFTPSIPIVTDRLGYYYLITPSGGYSKLQVLDIKYEESFQTTENRNLLDTISVRCPECGKFSSFAIATAVIDKYINGEFHGVLAVKR